MDLRHIGRPRHVFQGPMARAWIALGFVVALGIIFNADGSFFSWATHRDMLRQISVFAILACGMTLVIISAGIDLSVGSILGFVAVLFAQLSIHYQVGPLLAVTISLLAGLGLGAISGMLVGVFRLQPFIATLAMMVIARGLAKWSSGGQKISTYMQLEGGEFKELPMPAIFQLLNARLLGDNIATVTLIFVVCVAICWVFLQRLTWGRYLFAIGGNEEAAHLSGVPVRTTKILAYGLSAFFSAVAGICQAAQELQGDPEAGATYELTAIAIVVIGGTSLMGGRGSMGQTVMGAVTIGYLEKILSINAVSEAHRLLFTGLIIIAAVLFQKKDSRRSWRWPFLKRKVAPKQMNDPNPQSLDE